MPVRAASTSQAAFSMNQAARSRPTGTSSVRSMVSVIRELFSRLGSATCAPTVDRNTTRPGRAVSIAWRIDSQFSTVSGKPGAGS